MNRRAAFTARASQDVENAFDWYERQRIGLGSDFETAMERAIDLVERMPELGPVVHRDLRRILMRRFPYAIYYRVTETTIEIRGCLHQRRSQRSWRSRA